MASKNTICLCYDGAALDAATCYAATFPDSAVGAVRRAPGHCPAGRQGDVLTLEFTMMGVPGVEFSVGSVVADHPARPDGRDRRPGPHRGQARVRGQHGDDENRPRRD